jgi:hypothetical protein
MILPVQWQHQPDERWCWATVGSMVSVYFSQLGAGAPLSPCEVAGGTLGTVCCTPLPTDPPPPQCQTALDLERALNIIGHLSPNTPPATGFNLVQAEITNNRPLCAMVKFNGGPFHYVVLSGFNLATQDVMVLDPAAQAFPMPFTVFLANSRFRFVNWILTV